MVNHRLMAIEGSRKKWLSIASGETGIDSLFFICELCIYSRHEQKNNPRMGWAVCGMCPLAQRGHECQNGSGSTWGRLGVLVRSLLPDKRTNLPDIRKCAYGDCPDVVNEITLLVYRMVDILTEMYFEEKDSDGRKAST